MESGFRLRRRRVRALAHAELAGQALRILAVTLTAAFVLAIALDALRQ